MTGADSFIAVSTCRMVANIVASSIELGHRSGYGVAKETSKLWNLASVAIALLAKKII